MIFTEKKKERKFTVCVRAAGLRKDTGFDVTGLDAQYSETLLRLL